MGKRKWYGKGGRIMGEIHKLRVKSPYELIKIVDIKIENRPNEHGYLYLKCFLKASIEY